MDIVLLIIAALIIIMVLLQGGADKNPLSGFSSRNDLTLFSTKKARGAEVVIRRITAVLLILFFGLIVVMRITGRGV